MFDIKTSKATVGGRDISFETGRMARQAGGSVLAQVGELIGSGFADRHNHPFADDFVFHFFNAQLPDLDGDYHGFDGIAELFELSYQAAESLLARARRSFEQAWSALGDDDD